MQTNDGILVINKPSGISSYDVIRDLKHTLDTSKIGHSGTLDPLASGVLVLGVGKGTKMLNLLPHQYKTYIASVKCGISTNTLDITGNIIKQGDVIMPHEEEIKDCLKQFLGDSMQTPPVFSAKKIKGKRAYELARSGKEVELKQQKIHIDNIELLSISKNGFKFKVTVSKGCYIRSLINDICNQLNILGTMDGLKRVENNGFSIEECKNLEDVSINDIYPIDKYILDHYPIYETNDKRIINGSKIECHEFNFPCAFVNHGKVIGIYDRYKNDEAKPILMI